MERRGIESVDGIGERRQVLDWRRMDERINHISGARLFYVKCNR